MKKMTFVFVFLFFVTTKLSFTQPYDFDLPDSYGNSVKLSEQLATSPVLILFWDIRAKPSKVAMNVLNGLYEKYKDSGFNFIAVNINKTIYVEKSKAYVNSMGYNFTSVFDEKDEALQVFKGDQVPLIILLNRSGNISDRYEGYLEGDEIKLESNIIDVLNSQ